MKKKYSLLILLLLLGNIIYGHPHLFITPSIGIVKNENSLAGIQITWQWDKWFSEDIIMECDTNYNGSLEKNEIKLVYDDFFVNIRDFGFFMILVINNKKYRIKSVTGFEAKINNDRTVTYDFIVPVNISLESPVKVELYFDDTTLYTAFDKEILLDSGESCIFKNIKIGTYNYCGAEAVFEIHKN